MIGVVEVIRPDDPDATRQMLMNIHRIVGLLFDHRDLTTLLLREAVALDAEIDRKLNELYDFLRQMIASAVYHPAFQGTFSLKYVLTPALPRAHLQRPGHRRRSAGQRGNRPAALRGSQDPGGRAGQAAPGPAELLRAGHLGHGSADATAPGACRPLARRNRKAAIIQLFLPTPNPTSTTRRAACQLLAYSPVSRRVA